MTKLLLLLSLVVLLSGCRTESSEGACTLENFLAVAVSEDVLREIPAWNKSSKYEIICRDADKVSYRATEYQYTGGAHGFTLVQIGKEIAFFDAPQLTENFYFDDQAIHFIYNQYEIACYADGIIEAIVPR